MRETEGLTLLGNKNVKYDTEYNPGLLETFENKHPENDYWVKFNCPEFTSLCPITGQPDLSTRRTTTGSSSTARSSLRCARSPVSLILPTSLSPMCPPRVWWRARA